MFSIHPFYIFLLFSLFFCASLSTPHTNLTLSLNPVATIPAFPDKKADATAICPITPPPAALFRIVRSSCITTADLRTSNCCPTLAAWLYAAYSSTALKRPSTSPKLKDMPLEPEDADICSVNLESVLKKEGLKDVRVNLTCDLTHCSCGIRLRPLSCAASFYTNSDGSLAGRKGVRLLEKRCLLGCDECLQSLLQLHVEMNGSVSKYEGEEERLHKIHKKDCHLMAITWLLKKNATAYFHTVAEVLRVLMMSQSSGTLSCRAGKPMAVDSSLFSHPSSSHTLHWFPLWPLCFLLCFLYMITKVSCDMKGVVLCAT